MMIGSVTYEGSTLLSGGINVNPGAKLEELTITENGTYYPSAGKDGFSKVVANVPQPQPVLDSISITENGTYTPPTGTDGYNSIEVDVPTPQPVLDSISIVENGTYTPPEGTDGYNSIEVDVPTSQPVLDSISITSNGTYTPPTGTDGYNSISVNVTQREYISVPSNNIYWDTPLVSGHSYSMTVNEYNNQNEYVGTNTQTFTFTGNLFMTFTLPSGNLLIYMRDTYFEKRTTPSSATAYFDYTITDTTT